MTITHANATKAAIGDLIDTLVNTGSTNAGGIIAIRDNTTVLVEIALGNPAFGAANGTTGAITASGLPISWTAIATGDADNFQVWNRDESVVYSGSVTATSGGGDLTVTNVSIANAQTGSVTSFTYTPG